MAHIQDGQMSGLVFFYKKKKKKRSQFEFTPLSLADININ